MVDMLRSIDPSELEKGRIQEVADRLAAQFDVPRYNFGSDSRIVLNKTGIIPDSSSVEVFETMQRSSLEGRYLDSNGRQQIFYHIPFDDSNLANIGEPEVNDQKIDDLASFTAGIPAYLERAKGAIVNTRRALDFQEELDKLPITDDKSLMRYMIEAFVEDNRGEVEFYWPQIRDVTQMFGNPDDGLDKHDRPTGVKDPEYPILIPIVNVSLSEETTTQDPVRYLDSINEKLASLGPIDFFERRRRRGEVLTPEEIKFADQCYAITDLIRFLSKYGDRTQSLITAPFFPFEQINKGRRGEGELWSFPIVRDSYWADYRDASPQDI